MNHADRFKLMMMIAAPLEKRAVGNEAVRRIGGLMGSGKLSEPDFMDAAKRNWGRTQAGNPAAGEFPDAVNLNLRGISRNLGYGEHNTLKGSSGRNIWNYMNPEGVAPPQPILAALPMSGFKNVKYTPHLGRMNTQTRLREVGTGNGAFNLDSGWNGHPNYEAVLGPENYTGRIPKPMYFTPAPPGDPEALPVDRFPARPDKVLWRGMRENPLNWRKGGLRGALKAPAQENGIFASGLPQVAARHASNGPPITHIKPWEPPAGLFAKFMRLRRAAPQIAESQSLWRKLVMPMAKAI